MYDPSSLDTTEDQLWKSLVEQFNDFVIMDTLKNVLEPSASKSEEGFYQNPVWVFQVQGRCWKKASQIKFQLRLNGRKLCNLGSQSSVFPFEDVHLGLQRKTAKLGQTCLHSHTVFSANIVAQFGLERPGSAWTVSPPVCWVIWLSPVILRRMTGSKREVSVTSLGGF